jgi:hypothetical protein
MERLKSIEATDWSNCRRFLLQTETESSGISKSEWGENAWLSRMNHMREGEKNTGVTQRPQAPNATAGLSQQEYAR